MNSRPNSPIAPPPPPPPPADVEVVELELLVVDDEPVLPVDVDVPELLLLAFIVMLTVAVLESSVPSLALNVKLSLPL